MNFGLLFDNFDLLLDSPDQITKLNQVILQLAVQGKFSTQDAIDEPATELLKRIKSEKKRLIREKKIQRENLLAQISPDEIPYELPEGWVWVRLGEIAQIVGGGTPRTDVQEYFSENGIPWVTPADLYNLSGKKISRGKRDISELGLRNSSAQLLPKGSVLFSSRAPIGYVAIAANDLSTNQGFKSCIPFIMEMNGFIYYFLKQAGKEIDMKASGTTFKEISGKKMSEILIPLPPLNEQKRIVDTIENLLSKTQEIEIQLRQADREIVNLNKAALGRLLDAKDSDDFQESWQFILDNFDLLYSDERNIGDLKQAILQLAVQGKLVPQDPADEPATELLERIKAEQLQLMREKKIKEEKLLPPISPDEVPCELPESWVWMRLGEVCETITKGSSPNWQGISYVDKNEGVLFITSKNVGQYKLIMDEVNYVESKFNEIEPRSILRNGDILMNIVGASIGRTAIYSLNEVANINQAVCLIRLLEAKYICKDYFLHFFNSPVCIGYMFDKQVDNARANLSMGNVAKFLIPLPPLNEQKRIVAKVDELMRLCDELEEQIRQSKEEGERLMQAVLRKVFEGKDVEESDQEISVA